jgi:hypothetical protein
MPEKPVLNGLVRDNPATPEGKYLVKRRDGTVPEWPSFVLGAADPMVPWTLRFYAVCGFLRGHFRWSMMRALWRFAGTMRRWRREHWIGDPGRGIHRKDDPETVAEMKKGWSA